MASADQTYNQRIWDGDVKTVAEARAKYAQDPARNVLLLACALYSFRHRSDYQFELTTLGQELVEQMPRLISPRYNHVYDSDHHDRIDMLSTYFANIGSCHLINTSMQRFYLNKANEICESALREATGPAAMKHPHTYFLIVTTYVSLHKDVREAYDWLTEVARDAPRLVTDPNQKARIFCRLGLLYSALHREVHLADTWFRSWNWAVRACLVKGSGLGTRMKCIAALTGYAN